MEPHGEILRLRRCVVRASVPGIRDYLPPHSDRIRDTHRAPGARVPCVACISPCSLARCGSPLPRPSRSSGTGRLLSLTALDASPSGHDPELFRRKLVRRLAGTFSTNLIFPSSFPCRHSDSSWLSAPGEAAGNERTGGVLPGGGGRSVRDFPGGIRFP